MSKDNKKSLPGIVKLLIGFGSAIVLGMLVGVAVICVNNIKYNNGESVVGVDEVSELDEASPEKTSKINAENTNDNNQNLQKLSSNVQNEVSTADYSQVVENVMPAVVSIECKLVYSYYSFFGYEEQYEGMASGTGFIIGLNGDELLIATNNHVIADAKSIEVTFCDDKKAKAVVKGSDTYCDLAVISVDTSELEKETLSNIRIATIGDSDSIRVGSIAIAIGNSMGYGQSITAGYISALNREIEIEGTKMTLIQTDAAINPGNSGGPLLNVYGEVIGINSAKLADDSVESMGYAIPMSAAIPIINELMNRVDLKKSEMGYLGIDGKDVNESYANAFGMPVGVYVSKVAENSPAFTAGIKVGDIITAMNDRPVSCMEDLKTRLGYIKAGTEITLKVSTISKSGYEEREVSIVLSKRP